MPVDEACEGHDAMVKREHEENCEGEELAVCQKRMVRILVKDGTDLDLGQVDL